jgi:hypothetical protein
MLAERKLVAHRILQIQHRGQEAFARSLTHQADEGAEEVLALHGHALGRAVVHVAEVVLRALQIAWKRLR